MPVQHASPVKRVVTGLWHKSPQDYEKQRLSEEGRARFLEFTAAAPASHLQMCHVASRPSLDAACHHAAIEADMPLTWGGAAIASASAALPPLPSAPPAPSPLMGSGGSGEHGDAAAAAARASPLRAPRARSTLQYVRQMLHMLLGGQASSYTVPDAAPAAAAASTSGSGNSSAPVPVPQQALAGAAQGLGNAAIAGSSPEDIDPLLDMLLEQVQALMRERGELQQQVARLTDERQKMEELIGFLSLNQSSPAEAEGGVSSDGDDVVHRCDVGPPAPAAPVVEKAPGALAKGQHAKQLSFS